MISVLRTPPEGALYHHGLRGRFDEILETSLGLAHVSTVLLPRDREQTQRYSGFPKIVIPAAAIDAPSLIARADRVGGGPYAAEARRKDYARALELLNEIVTTTWDPAYNGIELIALMDANRVIPRLKRLDVSSKTFYAIADQGTAFAGSFLETALACDRTYLLADPGAGVQLGTSAANAGLFPMANGLSRLATRFYGTPHEVERVLARRSENGGLFDAATADELGLATFAPDAIDWDDEVRLAIEERRAFSPDARRSAGIGAAPPPPRGEPARGLGRSPDLSFMSRALRPPLWSSCLREKFPRA